MNKTSHSHISKMVELFEEETQPFRKVHRLIDLFETVIKTHTAFIIGSYFTLKNLSDNIKGLLAEGLRVPALGHWQMFSREILSEMAIPQTLTEEQFQELYLMLKKEQREKLELCYGKVKEIYVFNKAIKEKDKTKLIKEYLFKNNYKYSAPLMFEDFYNYFFSWDEELAKPVITFRNKYAHGATPLDEDCEKDIKEFTPKLERMLNSGWLNSTRIENRENRPHLITEGGVSLDLFPVMVYWEVSKDRLHFIDYVFFNDAKKEKKVSYLHYPNALHFEDKKLYEEFIQIIKMKEWKEKTTDEFRQRIFELTEVFKGRREEKKKIKDFIKKANKGFLFIKGEPGIGKSALIAQVFKEVSSKFYDPCKDVPEARLYEDIHFIEYFIRRGTVHSKPYTFLTYLSKKLEDLYSTGIPEGNTNEEMKENLHKRLNIISEKFGSKIILLIDGIDEGKEDRLIDYLITETYNNIAIIYSTRFTSDIDSLYNPIHVEYKEKTEITGLKREDIRAILYEVVSKYNLEDSHIDIIEKKSAGNPLYMKLLCMAFENREINLNNLEDKLPSKISDFYNDILKRLNGLKNGSQILKCIYILASAEDYLLQKLIELISGFSTGDMEEVLYSLQEVLEVNELSGKKRYQLFHESFREYVYKEKQDYYIEAEDLIVKFCRRWREYEVYGESILSYPMKFYSFHLFHLYEHSKSNILRKECYDIVEDEGYRKQQIKITGQYQPSFEVIRNAIKMAEGDRDKLIELGIKAGKLHLEVSNSVQEIVRLAGEGGRENIEKALKMIDFFTGRDQFILYTSVLVRTLFGENKDRSDKRELTERILNHLDKHVTRDTSLLNWGEFIPFSYMFKIMLEIKKIGLGVDILLSRFKELTWTVTNLLDQLLSNLYNNELKDKEYIALILNITKYLSERKEVLVCIFKKLLQQSEIEECINIAEEFEDNSYKAITFAIIGTELENQGKIITSNKFMDKAIAAATAEKRINISFEKALLVIGVELLKQKKIEKVNEIIKRVYIYGELEEEIDIIIKLAKEGKLKQAIDTSEKIENDVIKLKALIILTAELFNQGNTTTANDVMQKAIFSVKEISFDYRFFFKDVDEINIDLYKMLDLDEMATTFGITELLKIEDISEKIKDKTMKILALRYILEKLIKQKNFLIVNEVNEVAEKIISIVETCISNVVPMEYIEILEPIVKFVSLPLVDKLLRKTLFSSDKLKYGKLSLKSIYGIMAIAGTLSIKSNIILASKIIWKSILYNFDGNFDNFENMITEATQMKVSETLVNEIIENIEEREDDFVKLSFLDIVNKALAKQGNMALLEVVSKKTVLITEKMIKEEMLPSNIGYFFKASVLVKQGKVEDAIEILEKIKWEKNVGLCIEKIATELVKQGNFEQAIEMAEKIQDKWDKSEALQSISTELAKQGNFEQAIKMAEKIQDKWHKSEALQSISTELAKQGNFEQAIEMAEKIQDKWDKSKQSISTELAKQGNFEQAIEMAEKIQDKWDKSKALQSISTELAKQGNFEQAIEMAEKIQYEWDKSKALQSISTELAKQGNFEQAIEMAEKIQDKSDKLKAFQSISTELAKQGNIKKSLEIFLLIQIGDIACETIKSIIHESSPDNLPTIKNFLQTQIKSQEIKTIGYEALLQKISENPDLIPQWIPSLMEDISYSKELIGKVLMLYAAYVRFMKEENKKSREILKKLNEVIEISDWLEEEDICYSYDNIDEWINQIEDEDDKAEIDAWISKVQKGKMAKEKFEEKVKELMAEKLKC